jgi:UDP-N-acetylmuramyl pentapeptide synthase
MGIDSPFPPQNMGYLLTIAKPDISIFLNVHPTHTQQFDSFISSEYVGTKRLDLIEKEIAKEKGRIITESGCKLAIYNGSNKYVSSEVEQFKKTDNGKTKYLTFGESSESSLFCSAYNVDENGTSFVFNYGSEQLRLYIHKYVLPKEYMEIFGSAILLGKYLELSTEDIVTYIEKNVTLPPGRATLLKGIKDALIIDSSYNASKAAVIAFLDLLSTLKNKLLSPTVFLFGDMRELGEESQMEHEEVAARILTVVDYLYCVGPQTKKYVLPLVKSKLKEIKWFETSTEAGEYIRTTIPEKSLVLVKGSQNTIFLEEGIKALLVNKEDEKLLCRQSQYWLEKKSTK